MGDGRSGIGADLRAAADAAKPVDELLDTGDLFGDEPDWGSPVGGGAISRGLASPVQRRGPGRPEGSKNIATKRIVDFITARYPHPLIGMAEIVATPPQALAEQLLQYRDGADGEARLVNGDNGRVEKADVKWAYEFWFKVASELSEYLATKQPRQLAGLEDLPPLFQVFLNASQAAAGGGQAPAFGMPKSSMFSMEGAEDAAEVPTSEVPQLPEPAADTAGPDSSGS